MHDSKIFRGLPGGELVAQGLAELRAGELTVAALLVSIAAGRLREIGLLGADVKPWKDPERRLYAMLGAADGDGYARYNSLRRELDSFLAASSRRRFNAQS